MCIRRSNLVSAAVRRAQVSDDQQGRQLLLMTGSNRQREVVSR